MQCRRAELGFLLLFDTVEQGNFAREETGRFGIWRDVFDVREVGCAFDGGHGFWLQTSLSFDGAGFEVFEPALTFCEEGGESSTGGTQDNWSEREGVDEIIHGRNIFLGDAVGVPAVDKIGTEDLVQNTFMQRLFVRRGTL